MIPPVVMQLLATLAIICNISLAPILPPEPEPWEPDEADVVLVSQTVWGEYRGENTDQRVAVVLCICNRVRDPRFPDSIAEVVTQPHQFQGYSPNNPSEPFADEVREVLIQWHNGESWLDPGMCWFYGDGKINHFRNAWKTEEATMFWP